jgi:hypothetical protein
MTTQRTRIGQGPVQHGQVVRPPVKDARDQGVERVAAPMVPEMPEDTGEDLGIPEGNIDDDPSGYVPPSPPQVVAGRRMRPMTPQDLSAAHQRYAGNVNMVGDRAPGDDGMRTEHTHDPNAARMAEYAAPGVADEARRLMPQQFQGAGQQRQAPPQQQYQQPAQQDAPSNESASDLQNEVARAADTFEYLHRVDHEAKLSGNMDRATQTTALMGALKEGYQVNEARAPQGRHPVLQRLVEHFGLEKIKPAEVEWAGFKWRFAPTSTKLDLWMHDNLNASGYNAAALLLATSVVGIDGEPVYKVLNIPLHRKFTIKDKKGLASKEVTTSLYDKECSCGATVSVDAPVCQGCGAAQDVFSFPLNLRIECAIRLNKFFEEQFGAYEELAELVNLRDGLMKNRILNKAELYPFLPKTQSSKAGTTPE